MAVIQTFEVMAGKHKVIDEIRVPGDLVPEAETWRTLPAYLNSGKIARVSIEDDDPRWIEWNNAHGESDDGLDSMTVAELRSYAADNEIDLGDATRKADILEVIAGAELVGSE